MSIEVCKNCGMSIDTDFNVDHDADCVFTPTRQDEVGSYRDQDDLADYNNLPADEK